MSRTLAKNSNIAIAKSKFFINRAFIYFSFMLVPVWIQKTLELSLLWQAILMVLYMMFMSGQWYLLGKEIDHRLKIYFRANSSIDRILYRLLVGSAFSILLFNLLTLLPDSWIRHVFWGVWILLGLFYSWPTRGKIIEESVSTQFTEYRYLDNFEKTVLFLTIVLVFVSIPIFPYFDNLDSLKILIDPEEHVSSHLWNYLQVNYLPFRRFPHLIYLGWCLHLYFVGVVFFLLALYGICRFFFSRRISILAAFAAMSTWSFSLLLQKDPFSATLNSFSVLWIWALLWTVKSATYRAGLMYGLLCYYGACLNYQFVLLFPLGLIILYCWMLSDKTLWYRQQYVRYASLGAILILLVLLYHTELDPQWRGLGFSQMLVHVQGLIRRKAFFALASVGLFSAAILYVPQVRKRFSDFTIDLLRLKHLAGIVLALFVYGLFIEKNVLRGLPAIWSLVFLSILPLEWIFQVISRSRSKRNMIYTIYVLVCLLDSHFEGRVRWTAKFFKNTPNVSRHINN